MESSAPAIFAGLLDGLSAAIRNINQIELADLPRMADFVLWVTAAEESLPWPKGTFTASYRRMISRSTEDGIEASPVATALLDLMRSRLPQRSWVVTPTAFYELLTQAAGSRARLNSWPQSPRGLHNALKRLAPSLRKVGLTYQKSDTHDREYRFYFEPCMTGEEAHQAHNTPEGISGEALSMCASGAHGSVRARRSAQESNAHSEAHMTKLSDDGASGALGALGAPIPALHVTGVVRI
jgi:hypothetical protein